MLQEKEKYPELNALGPCREECAFCFLNFSDILINNPLFAGMEKREIGWIVRNTHHQVRELEKNEVFAVAGDRVLHLVFIVQGAVVGEMMDPEGNVLRVEKMEQPKAIASAFLFGDRNFFPVTVTATEQSKLLLIGKDELLDLFGSNRKIMRNFLNMISGRAQFLSNRIRLLTLPDLNAKLAAYLLDMMKTSGKAEFRMPHTQQELSELFGSTRPSVGRAIRNLHHQGIIHTKGKDITVLDQRRLTSFLDSRK